MAQLIPIALVAAVIFGICYLVDKTFSKLFRSKAQHRSGKAVRANKRYGLFGIILGVLGIAGIFAGTTMLLIAGILGMLLGGYVYDKDVKTRRAMGLEDPMSLDTDASVRVGVLAMRKLIQRDKASN